MFLDDIKIGKKLIGGYLIVVLILVIVAAMGIINMGALDAADTAMYQDRAVPIGELGTVNSDFQEIRAEIYRFIYVPAARTTVENRMEAIEADITKEMDAYRSSDLLSAEKTALEQFDRNYPVFISEVEKLFDAARADDMNAVDAGLAAGSPAINARTEVVNALDTMMSVNIEEAERLANANTALYQSSSMMMIIATIIAVIIAIVLAVLITRSITNPLNQAVTMIKEMGMGHLGMRLHLNRKDEIGIMTDTMDGFSENLQNFVVKTMQKIAAGDLSTEVPMMDDKDEIAPALSGTIASLSQMINEAKTLADAAVAGNLQTRGDLSQYHGAYRDIIAGFNNTLDAFVIPVKEAQRLSGSYAENNFADQFDESLVVQGDFASFKKSLNNIGVQVSATLVRIQKQTENLAAMSEEANSSIIEIAGGSQKLAQNSGVVSQNSEQGGSGLKEVLKAMEDFGESVTQVSSRAEDVSHLATQADELAGAGKGLAGEAEAGMKGINAATLELDTMISDIRDQMGEIGKVVNIISEISDETNLLALNAAIEAARAGEAGMGFAVVADEVKELAGESRKSAENIAEVITNLQKRSETASSVMKNAASQVEHGTEAVEKTLESFNQIVEAIIHITQNIAEVASASEEQAAAIEEITASANEVSGLITRTSHEAADMAAISEETSASVDQIREVFGGVNAAVEDLSKEIQKFKISGA
ncbi:MAG: methyl-accepting chemotaxis protein [Methanospirillaceae archaeon]|nr:methyl-accepting chemotaxis protein [Methanospirillaceae archaeon]